MRLMLTGVLAAVCAAVPIRAQQSAAPPPGGQDSAHRVVLPLEPIAHVGTGDSAARAARALVYVNRGEVALRAGMRDTARVAFEKALTENNTCTDAVVDLARIMVEDGDGARAENLLNSALRRDPTNPKLLHFSARRIGAPVDSSAQ